MLIFSFKNIDLLKKYEVVFLTYDEPEKEERWHRIQKLLPKAHWVDGIKGFDKAHRECAKRVTTERVIIIDGDNSFITPRPSLVVPKKLVKNDFVLSYSSRNSINGLTYGNGGIKCWPRKTLLEIQGHELSDEADSVDFCYSTPYYQISEAPTESIVHITPFQAFRAGFREGLKMSLINGHAIPTERAEDLKLDYLVPSTNFYRLKVWLEVGRDVMNGSWALLGARCGLFHLLREDNYLFHIRDYDWFMELWKDFENLNSEQVEEKSRFYASGLAPFFKEELKELTIDQSFEFKKTLINPKREGLIGLAAIKY